MTQPFSIDHHLQSHIVQQLMTRGEQSFSALKPADVENSLFMYHMRKLIANGIVAKSPSGFQLTHDGANWVNKTGGELRTQESPRPMVQLLVVQNDSVLISERIDHMAEHLNRYMLPGTLHRFGETSRASADRTAAKLGLTLTSDCIGHTELIISKKQHHSLVDLYIATAPNTDYTFDDGLFSLQFMPIDAVLKLPVSEANVMPQLVRAYITNQPYEQTYLL